MDRLNTTVGLGPSGSAPSEQEDIRSTKTSMRQETPWLQLPSVIRIIPHILLAAVVIAVLTVAFIHVVVYVYVFVTPDAVQSPAGAKVYGTGTLPLVFFAILTSLCSGLLVYRYEHFAILAAIALGALAAIVQQYLGELASPIVPREAVTYLIVGVGATVFGHVLGTRELRRTIANETALFNAVQSMGWAATPNDVAAAVARALSSEDLALVALWKVAPLSEDPHPPTGLWVAEDLGPTFPSDFLPPAPHLTPGSPTDERAFTMISKASLSQEIQSRWRSLGIRSAFLLPLLSLGGQSSGMMLVCLKRRRLDFRPASRRRIQSAAGNAAITLEKHEQVAVNAQLLERERVAADLHDSVVQYVAAIAAQLDTAMNVPDPSKFIARAHEITVDTATEARRVISAMNTPLLDHSSLNDALSKLARRTRYECGLHVAVEASGTPYKMPDQTEDELVRVVQEALANVRKHARATTTSVSLTYTPDRFSLSVTDDGVGVGANPGAPHLPERTSILQRPNNPLHSGGRGIINIGYRAKKIGATFEISTVEPSGTRVHLTLQNPPYLQPKEA